MVLGPDPTEVRTLVDQTFRRHFSIPDGILEDLAEIPMIDEGRCIARSYRIDGYMAMWLIDIGILQFYDEEGRMLKRANLLMEIEPHSTAA